MRKRILNLKALGFILASLTTILPSSNTVKAVETNPTLLARNNVWSSASHCSDLPPPDTLLHSLLTIVTLIKHTSFIKMVPTHQ